MKKIFFILLLIVSENLLAVDSFNIAPGATQKIDINGYCRKVKNNLSSNLFVPVKTDPEWLSFMHSNLAFSASVDMLTCCIGNFFTCGSAGPNCLWNSFSGGTCDDGSCDPYEFDQPNCVANGCYYNTTSDTCTLDAP